MPKTICAHFAARVRETVEGIENNNPARAERLKHMFNRIRHSWDLSEELTYLEPEPEDNPQLFRDDKRLLFELMYHR